MTRDELVEFLVEQLGICGCSDADGVVTFLRDLLEAGEMRDEGHEAEADALIDTLLPAGDCLERNLPVYWIMSAGLIEHGFSLPAFGLSEVGDLVLGALRDHGTGDALWMGQDGGERTWN